MFLTEIACVSSTLADAHKTQYLGWCHLSSPDLVRWTHHGPAVWFDDTPVAKNGTGFGGSCGTGGGAINSDGEFIVYCPHDGTGIYVFAASNSSSFSRLDLSPRPKTGQNCTSADFHGCAMVSPPTSTVPHVEPSDPGTPFTAPDGEIYQVWGNRGYNATVFVSTQTILSQLDFQGCFDRCVIAAVQGTAERYFLAAFQLRTGTVQRRLLPAAVLPCLRSLHERQQLQHSLPCKCCGVPRLYAAR